MACEKSGAGPNMWPLGVGERMSYSRGAKCAKPSCSRVAQTAYLCKQHYRLATRDSPTGIVDAKPVAERIALLKSLGIGAPRISELCGVPKITLWRVGRQERMWASTAAKIMSVPVPSVPFLLASRGAAVSRVGSTRRLRALMASGWAQKDLAQRLGANAKTVSMIVAGGQPFISADLACRVADLFSELQMVPGLNEISRRRALGRGFVPPLAWDDDIDDPEARPHVEKSKSDWFVEFVEFQQMGLSDREIAGELGIGLLALQRRLERRKAA